jgi:PAS domain S-box-containing protein
MMLLSYLHFFALISYLYLAAYLLAQKPRTPINRNCIGFLLCLALWSLQFTITHCPGTTEAMVRLWMNIGSLGWLAMGHLFLGFALHYTARLSASAAPWFHTCMLAIWIPLVVGQWRGELVDTLIRTPYGWTYAYAYSFYTAIALVFIGGSFVLALYLLHRFAATRGRRMERAQGMRLFHFTLVSVLLASYLNMAQPLLSITRLPPMGNVIALIWAGWLSYTLIKFRSLAITPVTAAESILATMGDMLLLCDPAGTIVTANRAACDRLGGRGDQIEGYPIHRFLEPPATTTGLKGREKALGRIESGRKLIRTLDGHQLPVILSSTPFLDRYGESAGTVIVAKDIHSIVVAEEALRHSQQRYRDLVENINDVIYAVDTAGVITYISPRIQDITGHTPDELVGRTMAEVVCEEDHNRLVSHFKRVLEDSPSAAEGRMLKKTGGVVWVSASGRPMVEAGMIVGVQGVMTDINQRVLAQKEKVQLETRLHKAQKMEAIGTLAGGVAHDLNNILGGIVSYPELLMLELPEDSPMREALGLIKSSGQKAATIVQDLLTMARRNVVQLEVLDLNTLIDDFLSSPEHQKQRHYHPAATINRQLADDLLPIKGSRVHLTKTLMNLFSNALEALPSGKGSVCVTTANTHLDLPQSPPAELPPGDYVVLTVRDTGIGIEAADQERIFDPFFTKKSLGRSGTGLGMAVVWGTVQDHGGHIEVSSESGEGTQFSLYLPATMEAIAETTAPPPLETLKGRGETIMVVDDVEAQRQIAAKILTKLEYRVLTAANGPEALQAVKTHSVDLLLLDMIMEPGWDGLTTYREILKINPHQKTVIASGFSENKRVRQALELGAGTYLKKPYSLAGIGLALRQVLAPESGAT